MCFRWLIYKTVKNVAGTQQMANALWHHQADNFFSNTSIILMQMILQTRNREGKALPCIFKRCSWRVPNGAKPDTYGKTLWNKIHIQTNLFYGIKSCVHISFLKYEIIGFKFLSSSHLMRLMLNAGNTCGTNLVKLAKKWGKSEMKCIPRQWALCRYIHMQIIKC